MKTNHLEWKEESRKEMYRTPIVSLWNTESLSPQGAKRQFTVLDCADWVVIVPVRMTAGGKEFVMVRQWRHGTAELSIEFSGGVLEKDEHPEAGAAREFEEECAYRAQRISKLGILRANPAIMTNTVHFFLAEDLTPLSRQHLDEDEFVDVECISEETVIKSVGKTPFIHSLTTAALALYHANAAAVKKTVV